jgi:hypothetical protein
MTAAEYRSALATLGLSQERAARILGVHPLTSHGWATGKHRVNETAARFLRFLIAANLSASTAVDVLRIAMPRSKLDHLKRCESRRDLDQCPAQPRLHGAIRRDGLAALARRAAARDLIERGRNGADFL